MIGANKTLEHFPLLRGPVLDRRQQDWTALRDVDRVPLKATFHKSLEN
jgi:hypothetical protein